MDFSMPPKWPRKPDRASDPDYRRLDDRMNFAFHVAVFAASNSGLWFFDRMQSGQFPWLSTVSLVWLVGLAVHGVYVFALAKYAE
jgi:2TM domain